MTLYTLLTKHCSYLHNQNPVSSLWFIIHLPPIPSLLKQVVPDPKGVKSFVKMLRIQGLR